MNTLPRHFPFEPNTPARELTILGTPENLPATRLAKLLGVQLDIMEHHLANLPCRVWVDPRRYWPIRQYLRRCNCFFYFDQPSPTHTSYHNAVDYYSAGCSPLWSDLAFDAT